MKEPTVKIMSDRNVIEKGFRGATYNEHQSSEKINHCIIHVQFSMYPINSRSMSLLKRRVLCLHPCHVRG